MTGTGEAARMNTHAMFPTTYVKEVRTLRADSRSWAENGGAS